MVQEPLPLTRRELLDVLLNTFADHVYFQPPPKHLMSFPCIRYELDDEEAIHANNLPYRRFTRYQVTVIDPDPDSVIRDKIAGLPLCSFDRHYKADNLNHYVYNLFF